MRSKEEQEKARAGFVFMSSVQRSIEISGLSYPQAAALLLTLICEMIQTAPDYHDDLVGKFVEEALPHAIELGKTRQAKADEGPAFPTTETMQ